MTNDTKKFIDLFAGIGGFHYAMKRFNGECVFASEINKYAIESYGKNHGTDADFDITKIDPKTDIPSFDVLCAGFPCQAFSKAGNQEGFKDKTRGTLFFDIIRVLETHKPTYIVLENVRNLVSHDKGNTWEVIMASLKELGYRTTNQPLILSPHQFGVPQLRERVFIPGVYDPENVDNPLDFNFDKLLSKEENSIIHILDDEKIDNSTYVISTKEEKILEIWNEFYQGVTAETLGFPVWMDVFTGEIDTHAENPSWKNGFIEKNQKLYRENKAFIDQWLHKHKHLEGYHKGFRKFEWQAGTDIKSVFEGLIQFRPSGVRVKRPTVSPALVAMVQVPIYGPLKRKLSLTECARLQSFPEDFIFNEKQHEAYKQLGNSVNVTVVEKVLEKLFQEKV